MDIEKYKVKLASIEPTKEAVMLMMPRNIPPNTTLANLSYNETPPSHDLHFHIYNRTILIESGIKDIVVQGDMNSRYIKMEFERFFDGIDLMSKKSRIYYVNANGEYAYQELNEITTAENSESKAVVTWILDDKIAVSSGKVNFVLEFYELNDEGIIIYRWQTLAAEFNIEDAIRGVSEAIDPDYAFYINYYENRTGYDSLDDIAAELEVEIADREIIMPSISNVVVKRDTMSRGIKFTMDRFYDGSDMAQKFILIQWENAAREKSCRAAVNVEYDETTISFTWIIDGHVTQKEGMVAFSIAFIGYNSIGNFYIWQTKINHIFVENGIDIISDVEVPPPSWLESMELQIDSVVKQSMYYVEQTKLLNEQIQASLEDTKSEIDQLQEASNDLSNELSDSIKNLNDAVEDARAVIGTVDLKLERVDTVLDAIFKNTLSNIEITMEASLGTNHEYGEIVSGNIISWSFNPNFTPSIIELNGTPLSPTDNSYTDSSLTTSNKTYVLVVKDAIRTLTQKLQLIFVNSIRWGVAKIPDEIYVYNGTFLDEMNFTLQSGVRTSFSVNCNTDEYIWFACPSDISVGTRFYVSSVEGGFHLAYQKIPYTNRFGYTTEYDIYVSDNSNLGETFVQVGNIL